MSDDAATRGTRGMVPLKREWGSIALNSQQSTVNNQQLTKTLMNTNNQIKNQTFRDGVSQRDRYSYRVR